MDCCATQGTRINDYTHPKRKINFVGRYNEPGVSWVNVMSYPFSEHVEEVVWIFPPRRIMNDVFTRYMESKKRPRGCCMLIQHNEVPMIFPELKRNCTQHRIYVGKELVITPNKKKITFLNSKKKYLVHIFYFAKIR